MLEYFPVALMFILFILRIPVAFAILISATSYFAFIDTTFPVELVVQQLVASTESFPYLAIPFFVCAGVVFNYTGITNRLMRLADLLVGHMRGGMGQVSVLISALMGGLSGSANADAAMQAKIIVPQMVKLGYSGGFAATLATASSCITPIIPPGIILILYGLIANVSIARMFFAGILPGIVLTIVLMITVGYLARKRGYLPAREKKATPAEIWRQFLDSIWALFLPLGILLGLRAGIFTPTEAGAVSVLYALFVGAVIYRELKWEAIPKIIHESVLATAGVMFIIAAAIAFGQYLTWSGFPKAIAELLIQNISGQITLVIVINLILLVVGCFFEGGAAMILFAPIFVPAILQLGIDPIYFGIVMSLNLTIAGYTPPFGTMMFVVTSVANISLEDYIKECLPFLFALLFTLALCIAIPQLSLIVPNLVYGASP